MKVTLIQTHLHWENSEKNISHFDTILSSVQTETDLIILPEMFTTGFTMNPERLAESSEGEALKWLKKKANEKGSSITGSIPVNDSGKYFNRLYWCQSNGEVYHYDKRHLFRMGNEHVHYTAGTKKLIVNHQGWNVCPLVCYDLRFPVWSRNIFNKQTKRWSYDVLIYVANWPAVRSYPWKQLLIARAIENQCYVIGVNRIGNDGHGMPHAGDSVVINPKGEIISRNVSDEENIETIELDKTYLDEFRINFPVGMDADEFQITNY